MRDEVFSYAAGLPSFAPASYSARWCVSTAAACPAAQPSWKAVPCRSKGVRWCAANPARISIRIAVDAGNVGSAALAKVSIAPTRSAGRRTGTIFAWGAESFRTRRFGDFTQSIVSNGARSGKEEGRIANSYTGPARSCSSDQSRAVW